MFDQRLGAGIDQEDDRQLIAGVMLPDVADEIPVGGASCAYQEQVGRNITPLG